MKWTQMVDIKKHRNTSLNDALFGGKYFGYIGFRLKFFFINLVLLLAVHRLEYTALSYIFSQAMFITLIVYRGFSVLVLSIWWGALEILRTQCRQYYLVRTNYQQKISDEVTSWLRLAHFSSILIIIPCIAINMILQADALMVLHKMAILVSMISQILTQTYHAGVYSLKRVYRPMFVLLLSTSFGLGFALLIWPFFGPFAIPITLATADLINAYISYVYSKRTYETLGISIPIKKIMSTKIVIPQINARIMLLVGANI